MLDPFFTLLLETNRHYAATAETNKQQHFPRSPFILLPFFFPSFALFSSSHLSDIIHTSMHHFPFVSHSIHLSKYLLSLSSSAPSCSAVGAQRSATTLRANLIWSHNVCQPCWTQLSGGGGSVGSLEQEVQNVLFSSFSSSPYLISSSLGFIVPPLFL